VQNIQFFQIDSNSFQMEKDGSGEKLSTEYYKLCLKKIDYFGTYLNIALYTRTRERNCRIKLYSGSNAN